MTKQHKQPCRACPWRRDNQAPGWLGNSTPGEFLQQSDAGIRMPCHEAVDYERADWEQQAAEAPQCAGRAIHLSNRCQHVEPGILKLPADHKLVFTRPHEFIAHHTNVDPATLEQTMIFDLYNL
ncbi:hypothetical protein [Bordetella phage vB_BbrM_PHB04]|uniref:Uncharacterized protein n=1 Tax=Bordetella phage vB_BbrM_PHB04 TaxID=2029657 RepID=A0A291L9Z1_9CAUD|nr:hypothetical protein HOS14_gp081 [Bordetella phage vB_BbrM_PHB04]ATI15699.1 hypothetical protein [Bordetella phage vB_BbrM_PHB04]